MTNRLPDDIAQKVSFIHSGNESMASFRYRTKIPAQQLGVSINDCSKDILIFSKPTAEEAGLIWYYSDGNYEKRVIVDFCDDHFDKVPHYTAICEFADKIVVPTQKMADKIKWDTAIIGDPYEFEECQPHCNGNQLLWFGHSSNLHSIVRIFDELADPIRIVSNKPWTIPWSMSTMREEFARADIVLIPRTKEYKSNNRTIESIRQGCFVVAEPHPSLEGFPGIWVGDIFEGIEWAKTHTYEAKQLTIIAQNYIKNNYSPAILGNAWKNLVMECASTLAAEKLNGPVGLASI